MDRIENRICFILQVFIAAILLVLVSLNIVQVITRYFVNVVIVWLEEATILGIYWMAAFGLPLLTFRNEHLLMDITGKILPDGAKTVIEWCILLLSLIAGVGLVIVGSKAYMVNKGYRSSILGFDECSRYIPLIVCGVLLIVAVVFRSLKAVKKMKAGEAIYQ